MWSLATAQQSRAKASETSDSFEVVAIIRPTGLLKSVSNLFVFKISRFLHWTALQAVVDVSWLLDEGYLFECGCCYTFIYYQLKRHPITILLMHRLMACYVHVSGWFTKMLNCAAVYKTLEFFKQHKILLCISNISGGCSVFCFFKGVFSPQANVA